jgi:hypothetical protein
MIDGHTGMAGIAMVEYAGLGYQEIDLSKYVKAPSREDLIMDVMEAMGGGQVMCPQFSR